MCRISFFTDKLLDEKKKLAGATLSPNNVTQLLSPFIYTENESYQYLKFIIIYAAAFKRTYRLHE